MALVDKERELITRLTEEKARSGQGEAPVSAALLAVETPEVVSTEPLVATLTVSAQVGSSVAVVSAPLIAAVDRLMDAMGAAPEITDEASRAAVHQIGVAASKLRNEVDVQRQMAVSPFLEAQRSINAVAKEVTDELNTLVEEVRSQEREYLQERDRRLAAAEAERKRNEAAAELERQRAAAQAQRPAAARAGTVAAPPAFIRPTAALSPLPQVEDTKVPLTTHPEVVVVDESKIPSEYWVIDMVRVRRDALAGKLGADDGVEVRQTKQIAMR